MAFVVLLAGGAFYVAFAQTEAVGSYQDSGCALTPAGVFPPYAQVYLLFEGTSAGYGGEVAWSLPSSTTITIPITGASSTCYQFSNQGPGVFTAYLVTTSGSSSNSITTLSTAPFTVSPYWVQPERGSLCAFPQSAFQSGATAYFLVEGSDAGLVIIGPGTTVTNDIGGSSTTVGQSVSACVPFSPSSTGTYTAYAGSVNTDGTFTSTEATTYFTVTNAYKILLYADPACSSSSTTDFGASTTPYIFYAGPIAAQGGFLYGEVVTGSSTIYLVRYANPVGTTSVTSLTTASACVAAVTQVGSGTSSALLPPGAYTALIGAGEINTDGSTTAYSTPVTAQFTIASAVPELAYGALPLMALLFAVYVLLSRKVRADQRSKSGEGLQPE